MTEKIKKQAIIVKGLVKDEKGQILLVRRKREWDKEAHDKWEFPGGKIEFGETPEEATIREVKEESGYDVSVESMLPKLLSWSHKSEEKEVQLILVCFICKLSGGESLLGDHGVSEIRWLEPSEVLKLDCLPGITDFLKIYLNN